MPQRGGFFRSLPIPQMVVEQHVYDSEQEALMRDEEFHDALDSMSDSDNGDCAADGDASDMALHAQLANDEVFFDPAMGAAMPEFQVIDMHNGSDEWLTEALLDDGQEAGVIQVIEVRDAAHAAEVVVVMPCYDVTNRIFGAEARLLHDAEHQQAARLNPFAMLTFKRIDFADGPVMCSCCENPGCNRSDTSREVFAYLFQAPDQQHQVQESVLVDHEPLCRCASAVIDARFGTLGTSDEEVCSDSSFWSFYTQAEPYNARVVLVNYKNTAYYVVYTSEDNSVVPRWGVLRTVRDATTTSELMCTSCESQKSSCPHMKSCKPGAHRISAEAHEAHMRRIFDFDTGQRRLMCRSRQRIPEHIAQSDRAQAYRATISQPMPRELRMACPLQCPGCGSSSGQWREHRTVCKLFCTHEVVDLDIVEHACLICGTHTQLDGCEFFVLRKTEFRSEQLGAFEVAFHWPLLYDAVEELMNGVHWNTSWTQQLHKYARVGIESAVLQAYMRGLYRHFREAVMDFVDLQCLPFDEVLRCKCDVRHQHLVADGITVSCMRSCLRFCAPWLPQPAAPGEPPVPQVYGSDFKRRFALERNVREALRPLTSAGGVCEMDAVALRQIAGDHLAAVLDAGLVSKSGQVTCLPWAQSFLRELSANSPACAIVRPAVAQCVERFLLLVDEVVAATPDERQHAAAKWTLEEQQEMQLQLPLLWPAMHTAWLLAARDEQHQLRDGICGLLGQLLQASRACFEPKPAPAKASSFQPEHLHASTFRVPVPEERPPHLWSREEAYLRTGVWSSAVAYEPGALGGACRELPLFAADGKKKSKEGLEDACTKKQYSRGALSPGLEVVWCSHCRVAVAWALMADSESPATLFELLYLFFAFLGVLRLIYDNACNLLAYMLNRAPVWAADKEVYIDALHAKGHTGCAASFSTATFKKRKDSFFANASYAEQENSQLAVLKKIAAHCRPDTLLWLVRVFLYKLHQRKSQLYRKR